MAERNTLGVWGMIYVLCTKQISNKDVLYSTGKQYLISFNNLQWKIIWKNIYVCNQMVYIHLKRIQYYIDYTSIKMNNYIITANNSQKWHVTEKLNFKFYFNYFKFNFFKHWYLIQLLKNLHMFGTIWMLFSLFFSIVHLWTVHIDQSFLMNICLHIGRCWSVKCTPDFKT